MSTFQNIKDLLSGLYRGRELLDQLFKMRKSTAFKWEYAVELLGDDDKIIRYLLEKEVIRQNGDNLEIDDDFLQFFELFLSANEEINTSYINENLNRIREEIEYYFNENNENRQYEYLRSIKSILRKIGRITLRNVIDLRRNIDHTYKTEPNYKNKKAKLKNLDEKRNVIKQLIAQTERLIQEDELTFFANATDEELNRIIISLRRDLDKCSHNLIEIERQIIDFLNKIEQEQSLVEKIRKIKYLKDQYLLETQTNFKKVLSQENPLIFEPNPSYPLKLSLPYLQTDPYAFNAIRKIAGQKKSGAKLKQPVAEKIALDLLQTEIREEIQINLEEVKNSFLAGSRNLYDFLSIYSFHREVSLEERVTLFCQLASQYEALFEISDAFVLQNDLEIALIYPK